MRNANLGSLVDAYAVAQKARIQWNNRIEALKRGSDQAENPRIIQAQFYHDQFLAIEERAYTEFR